MRIMIADDEAAIRDSLERVLQVEAARSAALARGSNGAGAVHGDGPQTVRADGYGPPAPLAGSLRPRS